MSYISECLKIFEFKWTPPTDRTFEKIKTAITEAPALALLNFEKLFVMESDPSQVGISGVLSKEVVQWPYVRSLMMRSDDTLLTIWSSMPSIAPSIIGSTISTIKSLCLFGS